MADKKISELTALTGATTVADDVIAIVDTSATETKKIAVSELQAAPLSAGTANGVTYLNASKVLTSGSALTFDGTNVGIGTSSPTQKLDVNGDALINGLTVGRGAGAVATNTANGMNALHSNTTGFSNSANGYQALFSNTTGTNNTANGMQALFSNTTGYSNNAYGYYALRSNTTGFANTAFGHAGLYANATGIFNTAYGYQALYSNTTGNCNTATSCRALLLNTTGDSNTASGYEALLSNTTGFENSAVGVNALYYNTTGYQNSAMGVQALYSNTTGYYNTANGMNALFYNTTGSYNSAMGRYALYSNTTGSGNTAINPHNSAGAYAPVFNPTTENNRFCAGSTGVTNAYIQVAWTVVSDARDKTDFAPVPHGLDFVSKLQPTAYRYKMNRDDTEGHGPIRYGFKAQDVLALEGNAPVIVDAEDADKLRFNDQSMIAVMVKAIQELKTELDSVKVELAILKGA